MNHGALISLAPGVLIVFWILGVSSLGLAQGPIPNPLAKLVEGATKEGAVVVYHSPTVPDIKMLLDRFSQKYPFVKASQYRASSVSLVNRVLTEDKVKARKWDVVILNSIFLHHLKKLGLLQRHQPRDRVAYGKGFRDQDDAWYGLFINTHVIAYNTRLVTPKDLPTSYIDMLDSKWKGKIAIDSEPYEWLAGIKKEWGKEKGSDYLKKLGQQKLIIRQGRSLLTQLLAAGEFPLVIGAYAYQVERMKSEGAPLDWIALDPVIVNLVGIGLSERPVNLNTAKLFIEFVLSREGQSVVREFGRIPARLEIKPRPATLTEGIRLVPSDANLLDEVPRVLKEFDANFKN